MSYPLTTRAPQPAADWEAANPLLEQFEEGTESDTGKTKRGPGYWNDLDYYNPTGGIGVDATVVTDFDSPDDLTVPTTQAVQTELDLKADETEITHIQTAYLLADFPKTNDTLEAVTGWNRPIVLEAGKVYRVTGQFITVNGDSGGIKFDFAGGSATALAISGYLTSDVIAGSIDALNHTFGFADSAAGIFDFTMVVDAGGTLIPRFAETATDATSSTFNKNNTYSATLIG